MERSVPTPPVRTHDDVDVLVGRDELEAQLRNAQATFSSPEVRYAPIDAFGHRERPTGTWTLRSAFTTGHRKAPSSSTCSMRTGRLSASSSPTASSTTRCRPSTASPCGRCRPSPVSDPRWNHDGGRFRTASSEGHHLAGGAAHPVLPWRIAGKPPTDADPCVAGVSCQKRAKLNAPVLLPGGLGRRPSAARKTPVRLPNVHEPDHGQSVTGTS